MRRALGQIKRRTALIPGLLLAAMIGMTTFASPASANPGSPFFTGSGSCSDGEITVAGQTATSPISDVVAEIQASSDLQDFELQDGDGSVGAGDTAWFDLGGIDVGEAPGISGDCSSGSINVSFFDVPTAPISYSGSSSYSYEGTNGVLAYVVPADDYYEAVVEVTQGAVQVDDETEIDYGEGSGCTNGSGVFTSSGVCDLGSESVNDDDDGGIYYVAVSALDGPQAQWTITIEPIPVALSSVKASPASGFTGSSTTISYTVSGGTSLTAGVYNSSNQLVDSLTSGLAVSQGDHSLTWGGTKQGGSPLPAGTYTIKLSSTDSQGNVSTQTVPFTITPVTVSDLSASAGSAYVGGSTTVSYKLNGSASVTATVKNSKGTVVGRLLSSSNQGKGTHSLKWNEQNGGGKPVPAGSYHIVVTSTDTGGDVSTATVARSLSAVEISNVHVSPSPVSAGQTSRIHFSANGPARIIGALLSHSGKRIRSIAGGSVSKAGTYYVSWTAVGANGKGLPAGTYKLELTSIDTAGDRRTATATARVTAPPLPTAPVTLGLCVAPKVRPDYIDLAVDGSGALSGYSHDGHVPYDGPDRTAMAANLRWATWTARQATTANAYLWVDSDIPIGTGTFHATPVSVKFWRPVHGVFTRMTITPRGSSSFRRETDHAEDCGKGTWSW